MSKLKQLNNYGPKPKVKRRFKTKGRKHNKKLGPKTVKRK